MFLILDPEILIHTDFCNLLFIRTIPLPIDISELNIIQFQLYSILTSFLIEMVIPGSLDLDHFILKLLQLSQILYLMDLLDQLCLLYLLISNYGNIGFLIDWQILQTLYAITTNKSCYLVIVWLCFLQILLVLFHFVQND